MKKLLPILLILCFSLAGYSQNKEYKIKMKVTGMKDSTCFLINYFGDKRYYKDTAQFNNKGEVVFEGKEQHPGGIYTLYSGGKVLFEFVVNNESLIDIETDTNDYIMNMKVNKSKENEIFFEHIKYITEQQKLSQPYRNTMNSKEASEKDKKDATEKLTQIGKNINKYRLGIIDKYPDLFVSVIFKTMKEPEPPKYDEIKNDSLKRLLKYEYVKNHATTI